MGSIRGVWECYGDAGMAPLQGILTNKTFVPPLQMWVEGVGRKS